MPVSRLDHYNLRAGRDLLDALRTFYVTVVGLEAGERPPLNSFGYWLYAGSEAVLHLSEASPGELRTSHVRGTFDHVAFACTDLPGFEARLSTLGIVYRRGQVPRTGQIQLFFSDPAGNGVELNFAPEDAARQAPDD
jgi:catechol-2,3-dioxygenase